jgi:hypothetical protein
MGRLAILLVLCAAAAACGRAPAERSAPLDPVSGVPAAEPSPLIAQIQRLQLDSTSTNAVLTATGLAPVQGFWEGQLVPVATGNPTTLAFAFRAAPPAAPARSSTPRSREVTVAVALSPEDLAGIRQIRVTGAENGISIFR